MLPARLGLDLALGHVRRATEMTDVRPSHGYSFTGEVVSSLLEQALVPGAYLLTSVVSAVCGSPPRGQPASVVLIVLEVGVDRPRSRSWSTASRSRG